MRLRGLRFRIILINRMAFQPRFRWRKNMWSRRGIGIYRRRLTPRQGGRHG